MDIRSIYILILFLSMAYGECITTGCSGQICAEEPMASDCAYLDWYTCFQYSECGDYGADGSCSWLQTDDFLECLALFGAVGCTDLFACNYNPDAMINDGSCEYFNPEVMCNCEGAFIDMNGDCCSLFMMDDCWVCYGDGSSCADFDSDGDGCPDDIDDAPFEWDDDYDMDGLPDDCDADDDNDGAEDSADSDDNNEYVCSDVDDDTCDDCSFGMFDPYNDGPDYNGNGICDDGDINDSDGDGIIDDEDSDPNNPYQCTDVDGDGCDDCSSGYFYPAEDGADYDADGICDLGDLDDDNDGVIDSEDCHPFDPTLNESDCCGVCGGDNSSCSNCCGVPFNDDCTSDCYIDYNTGECCYIEEVDECGICYGDNACLCNEPFIDINGHCLHQDDIAVLQAFIDNSLNSDYNMEGCDPNDPWCASPNLYMDQSDNWHDVLIDGENYQFANDNGVVEPLELGLQDWVDGRITSLMCGAYIYCQLSGHIPDNISDLIEIEILRLEVNYFTGEIPESVCELENVNFSDDLAFNFSYNMLCPPYPDCVEEGAVQYMDISECWPNGDVNEDGEINVIDVVMLVDAILNGEYMDVGDINGDELVNVVDIVMLVNMILN